MPAPAGKHFYTEEEDLEKFLEYRKKVDGVMQERFSLPKKSSSARGHHSHDYGTGQGPCWARSRRFGETLHTNLFPALSSTYEDFLEALTQDRFDVAFSPHYGRMMREECTKQRNVYLSLASPNFPNFFFIEGPTTNWAQGTVLITVTALSFRHQFHAEYALQCAAKITLENLHSLISKQEATTQWHRHVDDWHKQNSVWAEPCESWMKYREKIQLWSESMLHMIKTLGTPRYEDYEIIRRDKDMWRFLGNGRTLLELRQEMGQDVDMAPFTRISDEPELK
ncbi:hypothetical protein DTO169E5_2201 [Paecilomyces variotii]|nr:hypothetical protein DTO169E5_2201 [Paecilomyces variotii]